MTPSALLAEGLILKVPTQNAYAKTSVSTGAAAARFAMEHRSSHGENPSWTAPPAVRSVTYRRTKPLGLVPRNREAT